ncbi:MAG: hypothetical protein AAGF54_18880 [Pseudomonadota bacterium]
MDKSKSMKTEKSESWVEANVVVNTKPSMAVDNLKIDEFEIGLLTVTRYFLASVNKTSVENWQQGYTIASERWGETVGLRAAFYLWSLINSVLNSKSDVFLFHDPLNLETRGFVSEDEKLLIQTIHHMRRDQTSLARKAMFGLCNGVIDSETVKAGLMLSTRFPINLQAVGMRSEKPRLRLVEQ